MEGQAEAVRSAADTFFDQRTEFADVLTAGVAVVQPDLSHAGGISEVRRIAAAAKTVDALLAYVKDASVFDVSSGHISLLRGPGLGIEVDEDAVRQAAATEHSWRSPGGSTPTAPMPSSDRPHRASPASSEASLPDSSALGERSGPSAPRAVSVPA